MATALPSTLRVAVVIVLRGVPNISVNQPCCRVECLLKVVLITAIIVVTMVASNAIF